MGLFKRNTPAPCHRHRPPIDSRDMDGRVSGSLAAFKFAISAGLKKQIQFFSERSRTPSDSFISKNEGMAKALPLKADICRHGRKCPQSVPKGGPAWMTAVGAERSFGAKGIRGTIRKPSANIQSRPIGGGRSPLVTGWLTDIEFVGANKYKRKRHEA